MIKFITSQPLKHQEIIKIAEDYYRISQVIGASNHYECVAENINNEDKIKSSVPIKEGTILVKDMERFRVLKCDLPSGGGGSNINNHSPIYTVILVKEI